MGQLGLITKYLKLYSVHQQITFNSRPQLFTSSFCLKCPDLGTIEPFPGPVASLPDNGYDKRWWSLSSFRWTWINCLTIVSESNSAFSGMPVNAAGLELDNSFFEVLKFYCESWVIPFMSDVTNCRSWVFVSKCFHLLRTVLHRLSQSLKLYVKEFHLTGLQSKTQTVCVQ